jgi:hypothetical protein
MIRPTPMGRALNSALKRAPHWRGQDYEVTAWSVGFLERQLSDTLGSCPENNGAAGAIGVTRWNIQSR